VYSWRDLPGFQGSSSTLSRLGADEDVYDITARLFPFPHRHLILGKPRPLTPAGACQKNKPEWTDADGGKCGCAKAGVVLGFTLFHPTDAPQFRSLPSLLSPHSSRCRNRAGVPFQNTTNTQEQAGGIGEATFDIDPAVAGLLSDFKKADALCKFPAAFESDIIALFLVRRCVPC
jgi:hypothetical protein